MPTFKGKERHERGEMTGAFGEKETRNPEKAPVFLERQGVSDDPPPPLFPEGKRQNRQETPVKILRNEEFQERGNRPVRQRGIAAYHRNRPA